MKVAFEDYLPSASMKDGKAIGVDVEIITAAMKEMGVNVSFTMVPWNRCISMLDNKEVDAVIPMVYSKERDDKYSLGTSMRTRGNVVVLNAKIEKVVNTIADLDGMTIGSGSGWAVNKEFDEATTFKKDLVSTYAEVYRVLLQKVALGRNDGAVIDISVLDVMVKELKIENQIKVTGLKWIKASHVGFVKNSPYRDLYEKGYKAIRTNGTLNKILTVWGMD